MIPAQMMFLATIGWHVLTLTSTTNMTAMTQERRSLQFNGMFIGDNFEFYNQNPRGKGKKGQRTVNPVRLRVSNLKRAVADIIAGTNKQKNTKFECICDILT